MAKITGISFTWNAVGLDLLTSVSHSGSVNTIGVTNYDSTSQYSEFVAGIGEGGEISISGYVDGSASDGYKDLAADHVSKTQRAFIMAGPTAGDPNITGTALITSINWDNSNGEAATFSATIKINGVPTHGSVS